jgi:cytochrome c
MLHTLRLIALPLLSSTCLSLPAQASPELAQKRNCISCHDVGSPKVGPAYKTIAAKYAGQKDAAAYLSERIVKGSVPGKSVFNMPVKGMPANGGVSEAEAKQLATWILGLK